jgi:hypothetical protein
MLYRALNFLPKQRLSFLPQMALHSQIKKKKNTSKQSGLDEIPSSIFTQNVSVTILNSTDT